MRRSERNTFFSSEHPTSSVAVSGQECLELLGCMSCPSYETRQFVWWWEHKDGVSWSVSSRLPTCFFHRTTRSHTFLEREIYHLWWLMVYMISSPCICNEFYVRHKYRWTMAMPEFTGPDFARLDE
jgi:hypothetical protein